MRQVRDVSVMDQNGGRGAEEKCLGLGCILEVESTRHIGELERCFPVSDLNNWGGGLLMLFMKVRDIEGTGLGEGRR